MSWGALALFCVPSLRSRSWPGPIGLWTEVALDALLKQETCRPEVCARHALLSARARGGLRAFVPFTVPVSGCSVSIAAARSTRSRPVENVQRVRRGCGSGYVSCGNAGCRQPSRPRSPRRAWTSSSQPLHGTQDFTNRCWQQPRKWSLPRRRLRMRLPVIGSRPTRPNTPWWSPRDLTRTPRQAMPIVLARCHHAERHIAWVARSSLLDDHTPLRSRTRATPASSVARTAARHVRPSPARTARSGRGPWLRPPALANARRRPTRGPLSASLRRTSGFHRVRRSPQRCPNVAARRELRGSPRAGPAARHRAGTVPRDRCATRSWLIAEASRPPAARRTPHPRIARSTAGGSWRTRSRRATAGGRSTGAA